MKLHSKNTVTLIPLQFPTIQIGQRLTAVATEALQTEHIALVHGDVVAVASKIVSTCEGRIVNLQKVRSTPAAKRLAKQYKIDEGLTAVVMSESDQILGGVKGFLLTLKSGILTANAGVDVKNAPYQSAMLWPKDSDLSANHLRQSLERKFHTRVGVEIVDSRVTPLRLGTTGLAIGVSGFSPVRDERSNLDLYGRVIKVTQTNVADDIAASAHLLMGEAAERIGAVVIRNIRTTLTKSDSRNTQIGLNRCLVGSNLAKRP